MKVISVICAMKFFFVWYLVLRLCKIEKMVSGNLTLIWGNSGILLGLKHFCNIWSLAPATNV